MALCTARATAPLRLRTRLSPLAFQLEARRRHSSSSTSTSRHHSTATSPPSSSPSALPQQSKPLSKAQKAYLDAALRVNHAGELAATLIYTAQTPPINTAHPHLRPLMKHMYDQEAGHFKKFNELLSKHRVRPTAMYPLWTVMASGLGWATGVMGREAAMACTEAVETEIGEHYNNQVRELLAWRQELEARGEGFGEEMGGLVEDVRRIRDEELEHLDHAVENDAKAANPYELLTGVIRAGCRGAIWVSERV